MLSTLYLLHYNNYYNRIVRKEASLADYAKYALGDPIQGVNFIPNDWVDTVQIINWTGENPDYLIVVEEDEIISRWFVIATRRTTHGQLELTLHRDLVVDYYDDTVNAPCFIEKATPQTIYDSAIFNHEDMSYSQVKNQELLLPDETRVPWVVGYIPKDAFPTTTTVSFKTNITSSSANITVNGINNYPYYKYNNTIISGGTINARIHTNLTTFWQTGSVFVDSHYERYDIQTDTKGKFISLTTTNTTTPSFHIRCGKYRSTSTVGSVSEEYGSTTVTDAIAKDIVKNYSNVNYSSLFSYTSAQVTQAEYNEMSKLNGKIIYDSSNGNYYKITLTTYSSNKNNYINPTTSIGRELYDNMTRSNTNPEYSIYRDVPYSVSTAKPLFYFTVESDSIILSFEQIIQTVSVTIPAAEDRYHTESPYDIFCMPYGALRIYNNGTSMFTTNKSVAIALAQEIAAKVGSGNIYDVQLLPYCPVRYALKDNNTFDISGQTSVVVKSGSTNASVLMWALSDNFELDILPGGAFTTESVSNWSVLQCKLNYEAVLLRVTSPNFSTSFDFNPAMNYGFDKFHVVTHLKPFSPYIKLAPNFKGLYGADYNDGRGLILGGDFSLAQATSAWADYELQNKNYQKAFDRQIQNLQINNSVEKEREKWQVAAGTVSAGVQGMAGGAMAGSVAGPWGAAIGAAVGSTVGAASSLMGGLKDIQLNNRLRNETLQYAKDMYGYQLGNIQALPYGLSKTSAISPDNKLFPFVEIFFATKEEQEALKNKLKYNGYTIMRIDTIANFIHEEPTYIKGKLIRLDSINEDFHIINALAEELNKGVFI